MASTTSSLMKTRILKRMMLTTLEGTTTMTPERMTTTRTPGHARAEKRATTRISIIENSTKPVLTPSCGWCFFVSSVGMPLPNDVSLTAACSRNRNKQDRKQPESNLYSVNFVTTTY